MGAESVAERAGALANAVRLAQAEGDDASVGSRVREAVGGLAASEANEVLREAERLVPGWSGGRALTGIDGSVTVVAAAELRDAGFLCDELALRGSGLGESERRAIGDRLAAEGFVGQAGLDSGAEALARAKKALGLTGGEDASVTRLIESLALLVETVRSLDTLGWRTWRTMAPQSSVRKRGDLHVLLGRFVSGKGGESEEAVSADLTRFRQLIASLLASIGEAGDVAYRRVATLSPMHIEGLAEAQKGLAESPEAARWRLYVEMASKLDEATVQGDTMRSLAAFAEELMAS
ncbi:MAG: hypothetical protein AAGI53_11925 [Planctomycetota bacterium]